MKSDFSTQHLDEKPRVLILGGDDQLSLIINHILLASGFTSIFLNLNFASEKEIISHLKNNDSFYKTIWVDLDLGIDSFTKQQVIGLLQKRLEPLIYFVAYSQIKKDPNLSASEAKHVSKLKFKKAKQKTILLQDFVSAEELFLPWVKIFSQLKKKILLDPKLTLHPNTSEVIKKELEKILFSPKLEETILVRGRPVLSGELLAKVAVFFEQASGVKLEIKDASYIPRKSESPSFDKQIELNTSIDESVLFLSRAATKSLQKAKKTKKHPQIERAQVARSTPALKGFKTPPIVAPKIKTAQQKSKKIIEKKGAGSPSVAKPSIQGEIENEIKLVFSQTRVHKKTKKVEKKIGKTKQINKKQKRRKLAFFFGLFVFGLFAGAISLFTLFFFNAKIQSSQLRNQIDSLSNKEPAAAERNISSGLERSSSVLAIQYSSYSSLFPKTWFAGVERNLSTYRQLKKYSQLKNKNYQKYQGLVAHVFSQENEQKAGSLEQQIKLSKMAIAELLNSLSIFQIEIESKYDEKDPDYGSIRQLIFSEKKQLQASIEFLEILPKLLGESGPKNYLVLLQNNMEVRPGGGVIEAITLLSFESGVLKNYQVFDASSLEDNIKGEREAPEDFQRVFGKKNIGIQDNSWFLDFSDSSQKLIQQSETALGVRIDGVMAVNLISMEKILEEIGFLSLTSYNEDVNSKNIVEKVYFRASADLNSKLGKENYLTSLFRALFDKVVKKQASLALLQTLPQLAKEKQFYIYVKNQSFFDDLSWSGRMPNVLCPNPFDQSCQIDSIFQTETNIAANYSNRFVERAVKHNIVLDKDFAQHSRSVQFSNDSETVSWPGGTYRAYIRFTVDKNSQLDHFELAGKRINKEQVISSTVGNKKTWGVALELKPSDSKELLLRYKVPIKNQLSYGFFEQKQAGLAAYPVVLEISHSPTLIPSIIAPQAEVIGNKLSFSFLQNSDNLVMLQFK